MSKIVLILGILILLAVIADSPSYFILERNGITYKMPYKSGTHSPLIQHQKDLGELTWRILLVGGVTGVLFLYLKKKERDKDRTRSSDQDSSGLS